MTSSLLHGSSQLKPADTLIITKSMKDVMVLHEMGYQAASPMAENVIPSEETMADLIDAYSKNTLAIGNANWGCGMPHIRSWRCGRCFAVSLHDQCHG